MKRIANSRIELALLLLISSLLIKSLPALASLTDVQNAFNRGQYFTSARIAFNDANHTSAPSEKALSYYWVTQSLVHAGLDQSALYFFLRTVEIQDPTASKKVLELAPLFIERTGPDLMRKYLTRFTKVEDYGPRGRNAFFLVMAKEKLLKADYNGAAVAASQVQQTHALFPVALQLRATALTMLNQLPAALSDFEECARMADQRTSFEAGTVEQDLAQQASTPLLSKWYQLRKDSARDLKARCVAGQARVLYELGKYEEADRKYDLIPKASFVWTDTLFEHAWNSYAKEEYNRTLGKLVSYKSPALKFVFNTEIDVLMAQTYSALCIYNDAGRIIDEFSRTYGNVAKEIKSFVETNPADMRPYFLLGRRALNDKLHTDVMLNRFANRFVRTPYFESLALSEDRAVAEKIAIQRMDASRPSTSTGVGAGFPGFLNLALDWRIKTIQLMGGIFVRNSMIDYHQILISDFEKMQFMKIDILAHQKQKLMEPDAANATERNRGNRIPVRRDDQLLWGFNGEFWNDEIGDYVFALESECAK